MGKEGQQIKVKNDDNNKRLVIWISFRRKA